MGTGTSSKTEDEEDVRNRLNSGDFQKISPPSSPSIIAKFDEMSYSGILVEKPETPAALSSSAGASFAADLTTPPISNRSKSRKSTASSTVSSTASSSFAKDQPRRIVKATPPRPSSEVVESLESQKKKDDDVDSPAHVLHAHASPIGVNAATELLEESIEKNASKKKSLERVTSKQKSDREKLLQEKRRRQQPIPNDDAVQANPFSRFLKAFSVDANPTHKRKESIDANDPNKRLKFGFLDTNPTSANHSSNENDNDEVEKSDNVPFYHSTPWIAAASVATVAILVMAIVRGGSKKKY